MGIIVSVGCIRLKKTAAKSTIRMVRISSSAIRFLNLCGTRLSQHPANPPLRNIQLFLNLPEGLIMAIHANFIFERTFSKVPLSRDWFLPKASPEAMIFVKLLRCMENELQQNELGLLHYNETRVHYAKE